MTRAQATSAHAVLVACGLMPLAALLVPAPPVLLVLLNAPAALGCLYLGVATGSVLGKSLCLAWALASGGWVRESRSKAVLAAVAAAHLLALGGLVRAWTS